MTPGTHCGPLLQCPYSSEAVVYSTAWLFINPHSWSAGLTSGVARSFFQFWPWLGWMRGRRKLSNHSNVLLFCSWLVPYDPIPGSHLFDQVHVAGLPDISPSSPFMFLICTEESSPCWRSNTSRNLWETYRRYQRSPPPFDGCIFCRQNCFRSCCSRIVWFCIIWVIVLITSQWFDSGSSWIFRWLF